jgi:hypothetical protein
MAHHKRLNIKHESLNNGQCRMSDEKGGIAQMVERLLCKQDVSGSSPLTSTKKEKKSQKM